MTMTRRPEYVVLEFNALVNNDANVKDTFTLTDSYSLRDNAVTYGPVTAAVTVKEPGRSAAVGVPEIVPVVPLSERPAGSEGEMV